MADPENRDLLLRCAREKRFCAVRNAYETEDRFLLPLLVEQDFFLAAVEAEMRTDGYLIDRISSVERVVPAGDESVNCAALLQIPESVRVPDIDLNAPDRIFAWLASRGYPIYVECAWPGRLDVGMFTGVVTDCSADAFDIRRFDTNCRWDGGILTVPYENLLRLMFDTEILKTYGAVLPPQPGRKR